MLVSAAVFVAVAGLAALALPPVDEVPVNFPASVLWNFRLASIGARAVLWAALGLIFGAMTQIWFAVGRRAAVNAHRTVERKDRRMLRDTIASGGESFSNWSSAVAGPRRSRPRASF